MSLIVGALVAGGGLAPAAQAALPPWADAASAPIHPGVMMFTGGAQCTSNFIFTDGTDVYIGYAAHCAGTGGAAEVDGCRAGSHPIGTSVQVSGANHPGTLAYSSWLAMQDAGETNTNTCMFNDFALVRLHPDDRALVNPSIPHWGGPTGLSTSGNPLLSTLYSYGNSSLRQGVTLLSPKIGLSLGTQAGGWNHPAYTLTPGIPGDSGSAMLDAQGRASGVLSTLGLLPLPLSNNFGDLHRELAYAQAHGMGAVDLVLGTEAFNPNQLPIQL